MKRSFISFVAAALILGNISGVQALTTDNSNVSSNSSSTSVDNENVTKISLTNIKDIIIANNKQAKIYENNEKNEKLSYDVAKEKKNDEESAYNTAKSKYDEDLAAYNNDTINNSKPTVDNVTSAKTALDDAKTKLDNASTSLKKAKIDYNKNLQSLVKTAQNDYISYILNDLPSKEYNTANVQLLKNKADVAKIQYDNGFLSKDEYTTAQLKYKTALNTSNTTSDKEKNDKAVLFYDLGISSGENVTFNTNLEQDLNDVSTIKYDNDLTKMFDNNLTLQGDNIDIDQASDNKDNEDDADDDATEDENDIIDNKLENANAQLVLDKNNVEKNFKLKYDALMNSYASMKNSYESLQQQNKNYNVAQIQHDYGFASKQAVDESKVTSLNSSQNYQDDESKFYQAYLSYIEMKEGY